MTRRYMDFEESRIDGFIDFAEGQTTMLWDKHVRGLRLRIGKHKCTWQFYADTRDHGTRGHRFETLGRYDRGSYTTFISGGKPILLDTFESPSAPPAVYPGPHPRLHRAPWHMTVDAARDAARVEAAKLIEGNSPPNKRSGVKFAEAFDDYCGYLERKAAPKPPRWANNVRALGKQLMLPKWGGWTLVDMSERPDVVAKWHRDVVKRSGPTSANHCARIIRAMYKRRTKLDLSLSKVNIPTSGVEMHKEAGEQKGLGVRDFPKWFEAWEAIKSPTHRAFHMVNLLTGARPGELSRTRWQDLDPDADTLTIGDAKAGNDVTIPLTAAIKDAIKLAANDQPDHKPGNLIFPGCRNNPTRDVLSARGHALRRTYKTIATDHCGVPDDISATLLGHVPEGMSQRYLLKWARTSGPAIIEAQRKISAKIVALLHGKVEAKRKRAA
jgi:integrase